MSGLEISVLIGIAVVAAGSALAVWAWLIRRAIRRRRPGNRITVAVLTVVAVFVVVLAIALASPHA